MPSEHNFGTYTKLAIIPGNCLYEDISSLDADENTLFFMAEDLGFCTRFRYHKHKLMLILSAMRSYRDRLVTRFDICYQEIRDNDDSGFGDKVLSALRKNDIDTIVTYSFVGKGFSRMIEDLCGSNDIHLELVDPPGFMISVDDFTVFRKGRKKLLMNNFYKKQRTRFNILLDEKGRPAGGKWNFDRENRQSLPEDMDVPPLLKINHTTHTEALADLVELLFPDNPGNVSNFFLPTTREDALLWLEDFLENRLRYFGPYEDAISSDKPFIFHSLLSPLMNIGLLTPVEVVEGSLKVYEMNRDTIPLSSIEGFIRQIIGWREFMKGMYQGPSMKGNFFGHRKHPGSGWYDASLGIAPVDHVVRNVLEHGYCHHIERLMVLGNFMLLCEIHPDDVYKWFMEMFVDAYEWVMVPNVYGMSQFADGGTVSTKPYISGSKYILKMSDYKRGEWCDIWDALYWRFIDRKRDVLGKNFRMGMMVATYDRIPEEKKIRMSRIAEDFLSGSGVLKG